MKLTLLRYVLMVDAAVLFLIGALLMFLPRQVEVAFLRLLDFLSFKKYRLKKTLNAESRLAVMYNAALDQSDVTAFRCAVETLK